MDEILIGEKKYVSSKQAAKLTGYAKDYIGQLCREGRVPARLVGRSWYVLESAIQDHRFGAEKDGEKSASPQPLAEPLSSRTWQFPRYESIPTETLPSINRLANTNAEIKPEQEIEGAQNLQDSWKTWFDRLDPNTAMPVIDKKEVMSIPSGIASADRTQEERAAEDMAIEVPIHITSQYPKEFLPESVSMTERIYPEERGLTRGQPGGRIVARVFQVLGFSLVSIAIILVAIGSGRLDKILTSVGNQSIVTGISVYDK